MRKNSIKNIRINEEVKKELSSILREFKDPRIHPMTSILRVEVAPDLKSCKVYTSVLGDEEARKATLQGLKAAEGFIRRELARGINLRNTPEIRFIMDDSIEYGINLSQRIEEVIRSDEETPKGISTEEQEASLWKGGEEDE